MNSIRRNAYIATEESTEVGYKRFATQRSLGMLVLVFDIVGHPIVGTLRHQRFLVLVLQLGIDLCSARRFVSVPQRRLKRVRHRLVALHFLGFAFLFPFPLLMNTEAPGVPIIRITLFPPRARDG